MKTPIIDVSAAPFRDYVRQYGKTEGILYGVWYRVARPAMITMMWVLFSLYVYHSLVTVGGTAAQIADLLVYVAVVASMAAALVSWMIVYGFHNWIRMRDREETDQLYRLDTPTSTPAWPTPADCRLLLVHHDERGAILAVEPWTQAEDELATLHIPSIFPGTGMPATGLSTVGAAIGAPRAA